MLGTWEPHFLEQATNNDHFMDTQSLLRSLAGSVETVLVERDFLHESKSERRFC